MRNIIIFIIGIMIASTVSNLSMAAPVVWTGPKKVFIKADFADWTDAANQDRITDKVIITRKDAWGFLTSQLNPVMTLVHRRQTLNGRPVQLQIIGL